MKAKQIIDKSIMAMSTLDGDLKEAAIHGIMGEVLMSCELGLLTEKEGGNYIDALMDIIKETRAAKTA